MMMPLLFFIKEKIMTSRGFRATVLNNESRLTVASRSITDNY